MHNGRLWISVADTGVGMDRNRLKQIRAALNDSTENDWHWCGKYLPQSQGECTKTGKCLFTATKDVGTAVQLGFTPKDIVCLRNGL